MLDVINDSTATKARRDHMAIAAMRLGVIEKDSKEKPQKKKLGKKEKQLIEAKSSQDGTSWETLLPAGEGNSGELQRQVK